MELKGIWADADARAVLLNSALEFTRNHPKTLSTQILYATLLNTTVEAFTNRKNFQDDVEKKARISLEDIDYSKETRPMNVVFAEAKENYVKSDLETALKAAVVKMIAENNSNLVNFEEKFVPDQEWGAHTDSNGWHCSGHTTTVLMDVPNTVHLDGFMDRFKTKLFGETDSAPELLHNINDMLATTKADGLCVVNGYGGNILPILTRVVGWAEGLHKANDKAPEFAPVDGIQKAYKTMIDTKAESQRQGQAAVAQADEGFQQALAAARLQPN